MTSFAHLKIRRCVFGNRDVTINRSSVVVQYTHGPSICTREVHLLVDCQRQQGNRDTSRRYGCNTVYKVLVHRISVSSTNTLICEKFSHEQVTSFIFFTLRTGDFINWRGGKNKLYNNSLYKLLYLESYCR